MVTYKQLCQTSSQYNPELLRRLKLLYKGGYDVWNQSDLFLNKLASETEASYRDRLRCVSYIPFMSDIIDHYAAMLFCEDLSVTEAGDSDDSATLGSESQDSSVYKLFLSSADLYGRSLEEVMRLVMTDALIHREAFVGLDFPTSEDRPVNAIEEEVMQTGRPYIYYVEPECVIDWSCDDNDRFIWLKIKSDNQIQEKPLDRPMHQVEFKLWTLIETPEGQRAHWEIYQTAKLELKKYPAPNDEISKVDEGDCSFNQIPVLKLCLPDGLSIGNKIGPICEDIYNRMSILVNGENKSVNAMRIVYLGEETSKPGGAQVSMAQENPFRALSIQNDWESKGFGVLGKNDKMDIVESHGHAFQVVADQIDKLIVKLKEVVHQMANTSSAQTNKQGKSAASKKEDRHSTEILLTAYGNIARDFIKQMMACISTARGESIVWTVEGLDNFNIVDRDQLILEAQQFPNIMIQSKSETFSKLYTEKFYLALLDGASHEEALQIKQEIQKNVKMPSEEEAARLTLAKQNSDQAVSQSGPKQG